VEGVTLQIDWLEGSSIISLTWEKGEKQSEKRVTRVRGQKEEGDPVCPHVKMYSASFREKRGKKPVSKTQKASGGERKRGEEKRI